MATIPQPQSLRTEPNAGDAPARVEADVIRLTSGDGWSISEIERRQYEFEGGGAARERRPPSQSNWFVRLFRKAMRGA